MATYTVKQYKSVLNVRKFPDSWFWEKYGINPYNGCEHGCIYCDSRSANYHLPTDFENDIIIKDNIRQMLDHRLANARTLFPDVVCMSGASDPYHQAEAVYRNTGQCLEVLNKFNFPVHILTKSKMVINDLEIIKQIGEKTWACVSVTITTSNNQLGRFIEPKASSPEARFGIISHIKKSAPSVQAGILLMPVIPFLTDAEWQLEELVKKAKDSGADYLLFGAGMTMRNIQALWFLKQLRKTFPKLIYKYEQLYHFKYDENNYNGNYTVSGDYYRQINSILAELCYKYSLPIRIKRYIPNDFRKLNYIISEKLLNKAYELQLRNISDKDTFWLGMNIQNLKESIVSIFQKDQLDSLNNMNKDLKEFIVKEIKNIDPEIEKNIQLRLFN